MELTKLNILIVHITVALLLSYLSYMIVNKKQIPNFVGILLGFMAVVVVVAHTYFYVTKNDNKNSEQYEEKLKGLHFDKDDSKYGDIDGIGGIGWI